MPVAARRSAPILPRLALLSAVLLAAGCSEEAPTQRPGGGAPVQVTTGTVAMQDWIDTIEALGTARANESLVITAKVTETVERVAFEDGDHVTAGQVLVDLSGRAEVAQLEEAVAELREAQQQLDRQTGLVEAGTIPRSQLDTQIAARDTARARMQAIRARLADRVITAPFDGVLGFRQVSPGTLVTPGTAIATLDDVRTIKLDFSVPEIFIAQLQPGNAVQARSAAWPDRVFEGTVQSVDSRVDPVTRAVVVRAAVPNPDAALRPGMLLTVRLLQAPRRTLVVPEIALIQIGGDAFVFRVKDDGTVEQVKVRAGARRRGEVELLDGVAEGDRIVVEGTVKLRSGARVIEGAAAPAATE